MANSWMQGMEELSGKEGESILLSSRVTGNSIEPVIETFFISFLVSLLYNSSSSLLSLLSRWCSMFLFTSVLPHLKEHVLLSPRFFFYQTTAQISDFSLTVAAKWRRSHTPDFFFFLHLILPLYLFLFLLFLFANFVHLNFIHPCSCVLSLKPPAKEFYLILWNFPSKFNRDS